MQFSSQQSKAVDKFGRWLKEKPTPVFRLFGYAGTGKTTLAKYLAEMVNGLVLFAAPTGKAAYVLSTKGCPNTNTIHKLIYIPMEKSKARVRDLTEELKKLTSSGEVEKIKKVEEELEKEKANLRRPMWKINLESDFRKASLLVLDESSMVDTTTAEDLLSFGVPILALADPAQLPPVGGEGFFTKQKPDVLLTDIHRQAADNPIIRLSMEVREGRGLKEGDYGNGVVVTGVQGWDKSTSLKADQLLVGKNKTRKTFNSRIRELKGHLDARPVEGDKLICLRNNHENGILNGSLWTAEEVHTPEDGAVAMNLTGENGDCVSVVAHECYFHGQEPEWYVKKDHEEFDYGYAMTVHKSQGSQWDSVVLFDEWYSSGRKQWLYTGITRAAKNIQIVKL